MSQTFKEIMWLVVLVLIFEFLPEAAAALGLAAVA
jgi:hypothetical protein